MDRRQSLQTLLETTLGTGNVYFQPPEDLVMNYPAIVYSRDRIWSEYASNNPYSTRDRYLVTHISRSAVDKTPDKIKWLPMAKFSTYFVKDNLHHTSFTIYH